MARAGCRNAPSQSDCLRDVRRTGAQAKVSPL
jgi:hypothetical protein